jgi:hypothetical protein
MFWREKTMRKHLLTLAILIAVLMVWGAGAAFAACIEFQQFCDHYTLNYNPATAIWEGTSDGCAFGSEYPVLFKLTGAQWLMFLDFDSQGNPPSCAAGDYGYAAGTGLGGQMALWISCGQVGPFPVSLGGCETPMLSNGAWDPNPIQPDPSTGDWISTLVFDVCDPDDNLNGGQLFFWVSGTTDPFLAGDVYWSDFTTVPSATDCSNPETVGIAVLFTGAPTGTYCCDLEVSDGDGNFSNKLEDLCVFMP